MCDKEGPRYETFAKTLSLADFSRVVRCVEVLVKSVGREGGSKQQVSGCGCASVASYTYGLVCAVRLAPGFMCVGINNVFSQVCRFDKDTHLSLSLFNVCFV